VGTTAVWKPPLEPAAPQDMLDRLRARTPLDVDAVLDDIAEALNFAPSAASEAANRLRPLTPVRQPGLPRAPCLHR